MEVNLKAGKAKAKIISQGAELKSLVLNGRELMWEADPKYWGKTSPVLFPMIGNLRNNRTIIDGKEYSISKHGFARDNDFEVSRVTDNTASFTFKSNIQTKVSFPFDFEFTLHYTLTEDKLEILYEVTDKSKIPMPFCIGAHPAFACPAEGKSFSDYRLVFEEKETVSSPVLNTKIRMFENERRIWRLKNSNEYALNYSLFDNDCVYFPNLTSRNVSLLDKDDNGVKVSWEGFNSLGVWTPAGMEAPFVCLEPWCGSDDFDTDNGVFREKQGIQTGLPNAPMYYVMTIEAVNS